MRDRVADLPALKQIEWRDLEWQGDEDCAKELIESGKQPGVDEVFIPGSAVNNLLVAAGPSRLGISKSARNMSERRFRRLSADPLGDRKA